MLELVLKSFLLDLGQLFLMLFVIVVLQPIAKAFAELDALSAYFLLFLFVELVTFAQIADI